jgi:hypothetical protein
MLGHSKQQGAQENVFRLLSATLTRNETIVDLFLLYSSRYSVLPGLYNILGKEQLLRFLDIFGGVTIKVPKLSEFDTYDMKYSFLPEMAGYFGDDVLTSFVSQFSGSTLKVPPIHVMHHAIRDVDIYSRLMTTENRRKMVKDLANHYGLRKNEIHWIFRRVAKTLDPNISEEELNEFIVADEE